MAKVKLNIRKSLEGNLVLSDHPIIKIIIAPKIFKVITLPKIENSEEARFAQRKLLKFLDDKGVTIMGSEQGGNIYGSLEARIPREPNFDSIQAILYVLEDWFSDEQQEFDRIERYKKDLEDMWTDPDGSEHEETTELGEIEEPSRQRKTRLDAFSRFYNTRF